MGEPCQNCGGERWVCENHPVVAWTGDQTCCGGAGEPCRACNTGNPPLMPPDTQILWSRGEGFEVGIGQSQDRSATANNQND